MKTLMLALVLLAPLPAVEAPPDSDDSASYCNYVQRAADAVAAPLIWPQVYASAAAANAFEVASDAPLQLRGRFMAGVDLSTSSILRGVTLQEQALADCRRYRLSRDLRALLERSRDGFSRQAAMAKLVVLEEALPSLQGAVEKQRQQVDKQQSTLAALRDAELRLDAVRQEVTQCRQAVQRSAADLPMQRSIDSLLQERLAADAEVEAHEARLRQLGSWDISLRGGYDHITGSQEHWPVFGSLVVRASLGLPQQGVANDRALAARGTWVAQETGGLQERVEHVRRGLRASLQADEGRVQDLQRLIQTLLRHQDFAQRVEGPEARHLAEALSLDLTKARADLAYDSAHAAEMRQLLGEAL